MMVHTDVGADKEVNDGRGTGAAVVYGCGRTVDDPGGEPVGGRRRREPEHHGRPRDRGGVRGGAGLKLSPHDLRRTCAKLCRLSGGALEQIQFLLGHASVQTTERYLGGKQELQVAVNYKLGVGLP
jgi:hypothetical protein